MPFRPAEGPSHPPPLPQSPTDTFYKNATATRIDTDVLMFRTLKEHHSGLEVLDFSAGNANVLAYLQATGKGKIEALDEKNYANKARAFGPPLGSHTVVDSNPSTKYPLNWTYYIAPTRRIDGGQGVLASIPVFTTNLITYSSSPSATSHPSQFLLYTISTRDGTSAYSAETRTYLVTHPSNLGPAKALILAAGAYSRTLHNEIWVFEGGWWEKSTELYDSIQKANWDDIILPPSLKEDLLSTITRFYKSRETYEKLRVPWKRGIILYGPPGNGKTISIRATMKTLMARGVSTLYVKSTKAFGGPEYAIASIFALARREATCYLVFEDLDSLVTDEARSFFLNAVDGLSSNDGVLMVGSTNHLDRLDPGIVKRPSRFDRKYEFGVPDQDGRERYCEYWRRKLGQEKKECEEKDDLDVEVEFPEKLVRPLAVMMEGFSFAYMQEAFVSALLTIVTKEGDGDGEKKERLGDGHDAWDLVELDREMLRLDQSVEKRRHDAEKGLEKYELYREVKKQVENLKSELGDGSEPDT